MKVEDFKRAKEIQQRIKELDKLRTRLFNKNLNIYSISGLDRVDDGVLLSENMRMTLLGLCNVELLQLEEEFSKL